MQQCTLFSAMNINHKRLKARGRKRKKSERKDFARRTAAQGDPEKTILLVRDTPP